MFLGYGIFRRIWLRNYRKDMKHEMLSYVRNTCSESLILYASAVLIIVAAKISGDPSECETAR